MDKLKILEYFYFFIGSVMIFLLILSKNNLTIESQLFVIMIFCYCSIMSELINIKRKL